MIQANELRIGNWVMINGKPIYMDAKMFHAVIHEFDGYTPEPIPLTPEILEKCGCSLVEQDYYTTPEGFVFGFDNIKASVHLNDVLILVTYLHIFQNIVALTGEELTVNL